MKLEVNYLFLNLIDKQLYDWSESRALNTEQTGSPKTLCLSTSSLDRNLRGQEIGLFHLVLMEVKELGAGFRSMKPLSV